jgi:hypothetical protein
VSIEEKEKARLEDKVPQCAYDKVFAKKNVKPETHMMVLKVLTVS